MKTIFTTKKILSGLLIAVMITTPIFSLPAKKAQAYIPVQEVGTNLFQSIINTVSTVASEVTAFSDNYKEYVLDPLASGFAKMIIKQLTGSIVNWINSGFQGSPSFVQDPGGFFLDVADQATGQFISKSGVLSALCSDFNLDIRLALSFKYRPNVQQRYTCTLSTIIKNGRNAVQNASINGFTAGDFKQGGWPAFVSLSTEPQNNVYGAYLQADQELSWKIFSTQAQQQKELDQGRGFLSWKKCTQWSDSVDNNSSGHVEPELGERTCLKYETQTPGSTIAGALDTQLGSPVRQLELADELGEIVNALFAQLVVKVLQGGLAGSTKPDSEGTSYLNRVRNEASGDAATIASAKTQILGKIDTYITRSETLETKRERAYNIISRVKDKFDNARACYVQKSPDSEKIAEIDNQVSLNVAPIATRLAASLQEATDKLELLRSIKANVKTATTLEEIMLPSNQYSALINGNQLASATEIGDADKDIAETRELAAPLEDDAQRFLNQCR